MIEKIDKILHLKIELNTKDDYNIIGIEYYLHDTELQRKHSYRPNYRITFENCHQAGEINLYDMTDKQIKEYLKPFNPNDNTSLIQNFINIRDYGHIDKQKTKYYFDTDFVQNELDPMLDEIILFTHKDTLNLNQKKAIRGEYEREIDADTYSKLSSDTENKILQMPENYILSDTTYHGWTLNKLRNYYIDKTTYNVNTSKFDVSRLNKPLNENKINHEHINTLLQTLLDKIYNMSL